MTGGSGRLANALRPYFPTGDFLSRQSCDVANMGSCRAWFSDHTYDAILHLGAVTKNDADPAALVAVNVVGTANVVACARKQHARLLYTSTDYVYPGTGQHRETDALRPNGLYAWSKLGGEVAVMGYAQSVIVRGSWYSSLDLRRASTDGYTSKLPVGQAAAMLATISASTWTGVVNIGGPRRSLWEIVVTEFNPNCFAIQRKDVQGVPYPIPADVSLNCDLYRSVFGA